MSRLGKGTLSPLAAALLTISLTTLPAHADDASCRPVAAALLAQAGASYRSSITVDGKDGGEEIYTTTAIYRGKGGHWAKIAATPQERIAANREVGASLSSCRRVREEAVDGKPATVYSAQSRTTSPASTADMRIWIGASDHLPLRVESTVSLSGRKTQVSKLYAYGAVKPPAGVD